MGRERQRRQMSARNTARNTTKTSARITARITTRITIRITVRNTENPRRTTRRTGRRTRRNSTRKKNVKDRRTRPHKRGGNLWRIKEPWTATLRLAKLLRSRGTHRTSSATTRDAIHAGKTRISAEDVGLRVLLTMSLRLWSFLSEQSATRSSRLEL